MAKYFLGGVGRATAFRMNEDGTKEVAFVSNTLTDSGLNIATTKDDIRGGEGAPIQFSFYHDPTVTISLTDIVWKPEYLEAQLGAKFEHGDEAYISDTVTFTNGEAAYDKVVHKMPFTCGEDYLIWGAKKGSDEYVAIGYSAEDKKLTLKGAEGDYCIRYLGDSDSAKIAEIKSQIIPEELFLVIDAPIFAGDACAASKGQAAGRIYFEVPRFLLEGNQDFAFNMSSNQTMSLAGQALSSESADCDGSGGKLLRIIEVITNRNWLDEVESLQLDEESQVAGAVPVVYGILKDGSVAKINNNKLTFTPVLSEGKFAQGTYVIKLSDNIKLENITIS